MAQKKKLRRGKDIMVLIDLLVPPPEDGDYTEFLNSEEWVPEADMVRSLKKLGYEPRIFGVYDDIFPLFNELRKNPPDLVFNLCESFKSDRKWEPHIVNFLELMGMKYTGAGPTAVRICKDKGLTKKILTYHKIKVPRFVVSRRTAPVKKLVDFPFPAFVKPLKLEASEGIAEASYCATEQAALDRVKFIHSSLKTDAIVEQFIHGREFYVGVLGNDRLTVFPPRELYFEGLSEDSPAFLTYKAKWDPEYRWKWGIDSGAPRKKISKNLERKIKDVCKKVYHHFHLRGYARMDLRVTDEDEVYFLEANPNPSIDVDDEFVVSAKVAGLAFEEVLSKIISLAGREVD